MIYNFIYPLADIFSPFNLFRYLTFRSIARARRCVYLENQYFTAPDIAEAVTRMLREFGTAPLPFATVSGFIGKGVPNLVRRSLEAAGLDRRVDADHALNVFHRHYERTNGRLGQVFPHVAAGLGEL